MPAREVQPTLARQQKLAADRRHGVEHIHLHAALRQDLRGHQAGGAATDDGAVDGGGGGWGDRHGGT
jgi:hypothetical protein